MQISVVLPAYNEADNLPVVVPLCLSILRERFSRFELVVVNDGSRDATAQVLDTLRESAPELRVVTHEINRGYGAALRSGFSAATGDLLFFMDSDGQFDLREIDRLLPLMRDADAVLGYRARRSDPPLRLLNALAWNRLVRLCFGLRVRDIDGAFKLFRRSVVQSLPLTSGGAMINTELLVRLWRSGARLREVPVSHFPRIHGNPTGARLSVILRAFGELFAFRRQLLAEETTIAQRKTAELP